MNKETMTNTQQPSNLHEMTVPMTADDKAAITKLVYGPRGAPRKGSLFVGIVSTGIWIGLAYLLKVKTDSWWAFGIALTIIAFISLSNSRTKRQTQLKLNKLIRIGEVKVVEGIVDEYGFDQDPSKGSGMPIRKYFISLGGTKFPVPVHHLEALRYGAKVQMRFEASGNTILRTVILAYGDHDLEWTAPVTSTTESEEVISENDAKQLLSAAHEQRSQQNFVYLLIVIFMIVLCGLSFLIFGWHWMQAVLILGFAYVLWTLPKFLGPPIWKRKKVMVLDKKKVLEGILVAHEVETTGDKADSKKQFWIIGTRRIPISYLDSLIAEPGDRVRLHSFQSGAAPYKVERIEKRIVSCQD
jgi:hypothetical protein